MVKKMARKDLHKHAVWWHNMVSFIIFHQRSVKRFLVRLMIPPKGQMMMVQQLQLDLLQQLMMDHNASHVFLFYGSIIPAERTKLITYTMGQRREATATPVLKIPTCKSGLSKRDVLKPPFPLP